MNIPSPAEQLASRKRLQALFFSPKEKLVVSAPKPAFVEDPCAPRCALPSSRDWLILSQEALSYKPRVLVSVVRRVVCARYGVNETDLLSVRRTAKVVRPRQIAMYLAKTLTTNSLSEIGRRFGGRDHTTVLHAVRKIGAIKESDPVVAAELRALTDQIKVWSGL
jgi:hypothetical protein